MPRRYRMLTSREQAAIARRYPTETSTALATEYSCTAQTVRNAARRARETAATPAWPH